MRGGETELNIFHVLAGIFYDSFLLIWFLYKKLVKREKLLRGFADQLFIFFYLILILNLFIAVGNDVDWFDWLREYLLYSLILYYFPIREYFKEPKHIIKLLFLVGAVTIGLDLVQFYNYIKILKNIVYAYQFSNSMRINQHIFTEHLPCAYLNGSQLWLFTYTRILRYNFLFEDTLHCSVC